MKKGPELTFTLATGVMLLLATLAIVLAEDRRTTTFPEGSPQSAVQNYLRAISDDDKKLAFTYVAKESRCTQKDLDESFGVAIDRTIVQFAHMDADRGKIGIRLELAMGSVYGGRVTKDLTFSLLREGSQWKMTDAIWPMKSCGASSS